MNNKTKKGGALFSLQNVKARHTQGGIMTGNLGTRFPRNLHTQPKYFVGVPLFDKICIDMNIIEQKRIKYKVFFHIIDTSG